MNITNIKLIQTMDDVLKELTKYHDNLKPHVDIKIEVSPWGAKCTLLSEDTVRKVVVEINIDKPLNMCVTYFFDEKVVTKINKDNSHHHTELAKQINTFFSDTSIPTRTFDYHGFLDYIGF
ncbi:hypothetical protein FDJ06_gp145 [Pseudomonas phage SL2]|uniref:Uncharacterized protein n=4 Tax=Viruses TaxID=10239 RepID=A0AAE7S7B9_9CAUD|nr:hypothetical protein [Pseudomonas aeruginosa]YP_009619685.1 hypothetical protein FDJ06_gp145 [Pseudomonas phage SL2]ANM44992.1 hypothetical protein KTN4_234 [Pseudomonas phage KTN4]QXN68488.1 hypothetical protein [Pseudomonas phage PA7]USL86812.1 hypothetical protein CDGHABPJ_00354 [Pseudomonas phage OMKO1]WRQ05636.1 hypothetical protein IPCDMZAV_CDS0113 [Pseudomonas phage 6B]WRQ06133.1 hypothetical protein QAMIJHJT_CDS0202 [Pseudomonas phage 9-Ps-8B]WRQ06541.1 hypothetical protein FOPPYZ